MARNMAEIKKMESEIQQRLLRVNDRLDNESGIYFLTREDEEGIKYAYIGQAKHILSRLTQHMTGYQHIDLSIKKHGLISNDNLCGWNINFLHFPECELDDKEQYYILLYAKNGYQLRNKTSGSQGKGKRKIDDYKPSRTYQEGLEQGRKNASKEIAHLFDLHLTYSTKSENPSVNQQKAVKKFEDFLGYYNQ